MFLTYQKPVGKNKKMKITSIFLGGAKNVSEFFCVQKPFSTAMLMHRIPALSSAQL